MAAQRMRILDKEKMGISGFEKAQRMAGVIQAKFQNAQNMLHISAAVPGESGSWSEVKQVFPNQAAGRAETLFEPDVLHRGSIIQKFSTFPTPGQSLESFKEQAQRSPAPRKPEVSLPKKASLAPGDKLFSRIQELTSGQKEKKNAESVNVDEPVKSPSPAPDEPIQRKAQQVSPPASARDSNVEISLPASSKPVQRKVEQPLPPAPARDSNVEISLPVSGEIVQRKVKQALPPAPARDLNAKVSLPASGEPAQRKVEQPLPPAPARDSNTEISLPVSSEIVQKKAEQPSLPAPARDSNAEISLPASGEIVQRNAEQASPLRYLGAEAKIPESTGAGRSELALAHPVQKTNVNSPKLSVALPVKKPDKPGALTVPPAPTISATQPNTGVPPVQRSPRSASSAFINRVVQRQPVSDKPMQKLEAHPESRPLGTIPDSVAEARQVKNLSSVEMPLANRLESRQTAFGGLSLGSGRVHPVISREMLTLKNNPIQRRLITQKEAAAFDTAMPGTQPALQARPDLSLHHPVPPVAVQEVDSARVQPAQMTLAKTPAHNAPPIQRSTDQPPAAQPVPANGVENNPVAQYAPMPQAAPQHIIQRVETEIDGDVGGYRQSPQVQDSPKSVDIMGLAEKIFPLVKQLLEIESERTGSLFR